MTVRVRVTFPSSGTCTENRGDYDLYDTLYKAPVTLGRGKWIAKTMVKDFVAIPDPKISSRHCSLVLRRIGGEGVGSLEVTDLGSSNGSVLNKEPQRSHLCYPVRDGDVLRIGDSTVVFTIRLKEGLGTSDHRHTETVSSGDPKNSLVDETQPDQISREIPHHTGSYTGLNKENRKPDMNKATPTTGAAEKRQIYHSLKVLQGSISCEGEQVIPSSLLRKQRKLLELQDRLYDQTWEPQRKTIQDWADIAFS